MRPHTRSSSTVWERKERVILRWHLFPCAGQGNTFTEMEGDEPARRRPAAACPPASRRTARRRRDSAAPFSLRRGLASSSRLREGVDGKCAVTSMATMAEHLLTRLDSLERPSSLLAFWRCRGLRFVRVRVGSSVRRPHGSRIVGSADALCMWWTLCEGAAALGFEGRESLRVSGADLGKRWFKILCS